MRLVMLGNGPFAVPTLEALVASSHEVALVVARPPRGRAAKAGPVQQAAERLGIESWTPESANLPESQQRLKSVAADLLVVCDYGEILKPETLATTRLGGINLHGSLLPKYRGAAPVQWAVFRGEVETGNTVIQMTPGLDAGPCLAQQRVPIDPDETAATLEARLAALGASAVLQVIEQLAAGATRPVKQIAGEVSKAPRLTKEHGAIDWSQSALEIKNQIRAVQPWPRAYTNWQRDAVAPVRLNIDRVQLVAGGASVVAGSVIEAADRLVIAAGDGALEILELQPAGKRSMSATEFLRGNRIVVGDRFGA